MEEVLFLLLPWEGAFFMNYRMIIAAALLAMMFIWVFAKNKRKTGIINTKFITRSALFAAIAIVLYLVPAFNIALPIFPSFLKIHVDEIPVFIAGFAYGPLSALLILVVKTLVKLPMTSTMGVGELADFIYSSAFILPAVIFYKKHKTLKGAFTGLGIGFFTHLIVSCFVTTFLILKFYIFVMGLPEMAILNMCRAINPLITDLSWPFMLFVALPFNALKNAVVIIFTCLLYKRMHTYIDNID